MLMPWNFTPSWLSTSTTAAEKPHWGNTGVPFMNSSTSFLPISSRMRSNTSLIGNSQDLTLNIRRSAPRRHGGQLQGVQHAAHAIAQRPIDHLVLLDLGLAGKGRRNDRGRPMVAVAREVLHLDRGVRDALLDQGNDVFSGHRHGSKPLIQRRSCRSAASPRAPP